MPSHATAQHNSEIRRRQLAGEDISAADHSSAHAIPPLDNPSSPAEFPATREHFAPRLTDRYRRPDGSLSDEGDERSLIETGLPHEGQPGAKGPLPGEREQAQRAASSEAELDEDEEEDVDSGDEEEEE